MDFISWFCRECGGHCCKKFPVWQFLVDNKMMSAEFEGVGTRQTIIKLAFRKRDYSSLDCFYQEIGGCPDFVKPNACYLYVCRYFDSFILGHTWDRATSTSEVKDSTLRLYKGLLAVKA